VIRVTTIDGLEFLVSVDSIMGVAPVLSGPPALGPDGKPDPRIVGGAKPVVGQHTILTIALPPLTLNATPAEIDKAILEDRRRTDRFVNGTGGTPEGLVSIG
jgi:hypothetical protein